MMTRSTLLLGWQVQHCDSSDTEITATVISIIVV